MSVASAPPTTPATARDDPPVRMRFTLREFAGGLGDLGTFLPLSLALSVGCGLHLGWVFVLAGVMNVATGLIFNQPVPVQPMKAIAAIAVAGGFGVATVAAAGVWMGVALTLLACWPALNAAVRRIPPLWVAVIQAGVGLKLAAMGLAWVIGLDFGRLRLTGEPLAWSGLDSMPTAFMILLILAVAAPRRAWVLPAVVGIGVAIALRDGLPDAAVWTAPPNTAALLNADASRWGHALFSLALPQLPLTLLNSVVAVCALSAAYTPRHAIAPRRMAASVGMMNLLASPLGGMPMCHGAGGLAAQHHFGARTGGAVVMLGTLKVGLALALMPWLPGVVAAFPFAVLGPMVIVAGFSLAAAARPQLRGVARHKTLLLVGAAAVLWLGTLLGLAVTVVLWLIFDRSTHTPPPHVPQCKTKPPTVHSPNTVPNESHPTD